MFTLTTKLVLSPLLTMQALYVIRSALVLSEPEGARSGTLGQGRPLRLLVVGDSSAAGVGASHQSLALSGQLTQHLSAGHALTWQLHAKTGATSRRSLAYLNKLPPEPFDAALVILGVNDVTRLVRPTKWLAQQKALHSLLQTKFAVHHIYRSGLPPMRQFPLLPQPLRHILGADAKRLDLALADLCANSPALTHIPLNLPFAPEYIAEDGFHPSEAAYTKWADILAYRILKAS